MRAFFLTARATSCENTEVSLTVQRLRDKESDQKATICHVSNILCLKHTLSLNVKLGYPLQTWREVLIE